MQQKEKEWEEKQNKGREPDREFQKENKWNGVRGENQERVAERKSLRMEGEDRAKESTRGKGGWREERLGACEKARDHYTQLCK